MIPAAIGTLYELATTGKVTAAGPLAGAAGGAVGGAVGGKAGAVVGSAIGVEAKKMLTSKPTPTPMAKIAPVQVAALESTRAAQEDLLRRRRKSLATRLKLGEPSLQVQKLGTSGTLGT